VRIAALRHRLRALGANAAHEQHVLRRWLHAQPQDSGRRRIEHYLPRALRDALPALTDELARLARLHSEHPGADGSARLLVSLADGQSVEAVRLPHSEGLCVSTQVGCAVGCVFCMTGRSGLLRQLGSAEIVAQVALARQARPVHKVVFMGMGEPAHNLDNVMEAIELLGHEGGIGHKNLVLSTVGDARVFERLHSLPAGAVRPALALSLHTTDDALRRQLLPRAPRMTVEELIDQSERYARAVHYPIQVQWTLIAGVNDGDVEIEGIVERLRGKYAILNLIPYNRVDGFDHARPAPERCTQIFRALNQRGVLTRLRQSAGQEVDAGCGQLRSRVVTLRAA
jgi:23S rRNA (adenine2503-C2)-methyltransferase